jgi:NAD(P)-dependent dehydrogenase (short-subunit alcohol dehydrogenase family)
MSTVYVTGASAGLGRAIADAFSARGDAVGIIGRDEEALAAAAEELGSRVAWAAADVADYQALEAAADRIAGEIGPPDVWVNNAMVTVFSPFADVTPDEFEQVTRVTYLGGVHGLQIALRAMAPRGHGHMIQIGSALAYRPIPLQAPYCAAKAAITAAVDALRCELIHDGSPLQLTTVHMPAMNTPQFDWARRHVAHEPQPMPPIYSPAACARAVVHAARHPELREVWVGRSSVQAILGTRLIPANMDLLMAKRAYDGQFERPAEKADRPGNLFAPVAGAHRALGRFTDRMRDRVRWIGTSAIRERVVYGVLALLVLLLWLD